MAETRMYRLRARYWDNVRVHEEGEVLPFPEGTAPKGSVLVEDEVPAPVKSGKSAKA